MMRVESEVTLEHWPEDRDVSEGLAEVLEGEYRVEVFDATKLGRPPVIIDAGANIGAFTAWARHEYPGCEVHAYEPHPRNARLFRLNHPDVDFSEAAIVNSGEEKRLDKVTFYEGADGCGMGSLVCSGGQQRGVTYEVATVEAADLPPCDFLKVDTEGSEMPILGGYRHLDGVKVVALEWHSWDDQFYLGAFLASRGFRCVHQNVRPPLDNMGERFWGHYGLLKFVRPEFLTECTACHVGPGLRRGFACADGTFGCRECGDNWRGKEEAP